MVILSRVVTMELERNGGRKGPSVLKIKATGRLAKGLEVRSKEKKYQV